MDLTDSGGGLQGVKVIFRKFLNIVAMANLMKSNMELLDKLFEIHLRPLRSPMARAIYKVFLENRRYPYLTTLEIQEELARRGIERDKREINAWLKSLLKAGLIERGERRRPVRSDYRGRYTYLTWRLTPLGERIGERINLLIEEPKQTITQLDGAEAQRILELSLILRILRALHLKGGYMSLRELQRRMSPEKRELEEVLNRCIRELGVVEVRERRGFLSLILRFLGIKLLEFRLSERGKKTMERLLEAMH